MASKKVYLGAILLVILSISAYVTFQNQVKIQVDMPSSSFYLRENNGWILAGREINKLYNGTKSISMNTSNRQIETFYDNLTNISSIVRTAQYKSGSVIRDTYTFDGNTNDISNVPISHKIEVFNGTGFIYDYYVSNLPYSRETKYIYDTEISLDKNMKVKWSEGSYYAKITSSGILNIKYKLISDYAVFYNKLFDPWWNTTYEVCQIITITRTMEIPENYTHRLIFNTTNVNYAKIQSDGDDIRFIKGNTCTDTTTTLYNYTIVSFNVSGNSSIDVMTKDKNVSTIILYYNNSAATNGQNPNYTYLFFQNLSNYNCSFFQSASIPAGGNPGTSGCTVVTTHIKLQKTVDADSAVAWMPNLTLFPFANTTNNINLTVRLNYTVPDSNSQINVQIHVPDNTQAGGPLIRLLTITNKLQFLNDTLTTEVESIIAESAGREENYTIYHNGTFVFYNWTSLGTGSNQSTRHAFSTVNSTRQAPIFKLSYYTGGGVGELGIKEIKVTTLMNVTPTYFFNTTQSYRIGGNLSNFTNFTIEGTNTSKTYELGTIANITIDLNGSVSTNIVCLDLDYPWLWGYNYVCGNDTLQINYTTLAFINKFNDGTYAKNFTFTGTQNLSSNISINKYAIIDNVSLSIYGYQNGGNYPSDISIDFLNDSIVDYSIGGTLTGNSAIQTKTNKSATSENILLTGSLSNQFIYIPIPKSSNVSSATVDLNPYEVWGRTSIEPSKTIDMSKIAMDSNGNQHIAYRVYNGSELRYAVRNGSSFSSERITTDSSIGEFAIAVNQTDNLPYVMYRTSSNIKIVFRNSTGSWNNVVTYTNASADLVLGQDTLDMKLENNKIYSCFAYEEVAFPYIGDLMYYTNSGGSFSSEIIDQDSMGYSGCSLDLNSTYNPWVAFSQVAGLYVLYIANRTTTWNFESDYNGFTYPKLYFDDTTKYKHIVVHDTGGGVTYTNYSDSQITIDTEVVVSIASGSQAYPGGIFVKTDGSIHTVVGQQGSLPDSGVDCEHYLNSTNGGQTWNSYPLFSDSEETAINDNMLYINMVPFAGKPQISGAFVQNAWAGVLYFYNLSTAANFTIDTGYDSVDDYNISSLSSNQNNVDISPAAFNAYLSTCSPNSLGICNVPLELNSIFAGGVNVTDIQISYSITSISLNSTSLQNYLTNWVALGNNNLSNITVKMTSTNGIVEVNNISIFIQGFANYTLRARFTGNTTHNITNSTILINVSSSRYNYTFPKNVYFIEFLPINSTQKNVSAYGQTQTTPILNLTMLNYDRNSNLSILINYTNSCVNLSMNTTWNLGSSMLPNNTWVDIIRNQPYGTNVPLNIWAHYNCSGTNYGLAYVDIAIRGCCVNCVCGVS